MTLSRYLIAIILLRFHYIFSIIFVLLFTSCGTNQVIISPDYSNKSIQNLELKENIKVIKVVDNRESNTSIGTAQVGLFNKEVPYQIDEELPDFVEQSINNMIIDNINATKILPIKVVIDEFMIYEKTGMFSEIGHFECNLDFIYPYADDSLIVINTSSHKEYSGMDVTNSLENLIYSGIAECVNDFVNQFVKKRSNYLVESKISSRIFKYQTQDYLSNKDTVKSEVMESNDNVNIGFSYSIGNDIDFGVQLLYQKYDSLSTNFYGGFGYSIQYIRLKDTYAFSDAFFLNYSFRYALRYYLLNQNNGLYFGGAFKLLFGSERISYLDGEDYNFFFGATFEEVIGYSINDNVMLELGSYQIKLFNSDLLSSDVGYSLGILIGI